MNLGVYVSTLNEDRLIEAALKHLVKVFPQVEVIDLGSTDKTLEIVERLNVPVNKHTLHKKTSKYAFDGPCYEWIRIKNEYKAKHDWMLLLDGDEIFDEENLLKLREKIDYTMSTPQRLTPNGEGAYTALNIQWKMVRETSKRLQKSNIRRSGLKFIKCSDYVFLKGWPNERSARLDVSTGIPEPMDKCDIWCWHGVLLNRSSLPEATARRKKRAERAKVFDAELEWEDIPKRPWT